MALTKTNWRNAAMAIAPCIDSRHPPYANLKGMQMHRTRSPPGAWVRVWVWVPKEFAEMERTKE